MPEMSLENRRRWAGRLPDGWLALYRGGHRYGPPSLEHPPPTVTVGHPQSFKDPERDVPQPRALIEQRRQINARAYLAALEEEGNQD